MILDLFPIWHSKINEADISTVIEVGGEKFKGYNQPKRDKQGGKKFVVAAKVGDKVRLVRFGDANMEIKRDNPERRKSFRARHKCDQKKDKLSAGYWSCKKW